MLPRIFAFIVVISFACEGITQKFIYLETFNVDSLLLILPNQHDEDRVNSLNGLAVSLFFVDNTQSIQYADEAMSLARELNYDLGMAAAHRNYGYIFQYQGNYPYALKNYFEALSGYEKMDKKRTSALICHEIAITYYLAKNYEKTIEYGNIALDKYRERTQGGATVGNLRDTMNVIDGLGLIYFLLGECDKSLSNTLRYLEVGKRNNFEKTDIFLHIILAGERFRCNGETDSAKVYLKKALLYPNVNPSIEALKYRSISSLGYLHSAEGEVDSAIFYYQKAFEFYQKKGFLFWALIASNNLGYTYYNKSNLNIAEMYYQQSKRIFNEIITKNSWYRHDSLKRIVTYEK